METFFVFKVSCEYLCPAMEKKDLEKSIVAIATDLFLTLGFKSVTMDDIAVQMGISKKTIYTFFENKEQLVQAAVFKLYDAITSGIENIRQQSENPITELFEVKMFLMHRLKGEKTSPQYQLQKYYPSIHKELQQKQFQFVTNTVVKSLQKGVEMKLFRSDINIDFIARMYYNGMTAIKNVELFPSENYTAEKLMEYYLEYHLRAIVTDKGKQLLNPFLKTAYA